MTYEKRYAYYRRIATTVHFIYLQKSPNCHCTHQTNPMLCVLSPADCTVCLLPTAHLISHSGEGDEINALSPDIAVAVPMDWLPVDIIPELGPEEI